MKFLSYAAGALIALVAMVWVVSPPVSDPEPASAVAAAEVSHSDIGGKVFEAVGGEIRHEMLEDGSSVLPFPGTRLQFDVSGSRRVVVLHRGHARFTVAKDPKRPFTVQVGLIDAIAIGTVFSVWAGDCTRVEVHEGLVQVSGRGVRAGVQRLVKAKEFADVPQGCSKVALANSNSTTTTAK